MPSKPAPANIPVTFSTSFSIGPSIHFTLIDAPPEYTCDFTENFTPGNASFKAFLTSFAVSAQLKYDLSSIVFHLTTLTVTYSRCEYLRVTLAALATSCKGVGGGEILFR